MARTPIPTWYFVLVAVRLGHRLLVVHEAKRDQRWYLPAGRVEFAESFKEAAHREVLEEAGIRIELEGILRVEHTPMLEAARSRVIFVARPLDDTPPKSEPDSESLEARWVTLEELDALDLRGEEVRRIFQYVLDGGPIMPLSMLGVEGQDFSAGR